MKILHIIPYYIPALGFGGPLTVCSNYAESQSKNGNEVTVVTTNVLNDKEIITKEKEYINGVKILRFPILSPYLAKRYNFYYSFGFAKWYKNNCKEFDIIHLHDFFTPQNIFVLGNTKRQNNYIIQPHGSSVPIHERGLEFVKSLFNLVWGKRILRGAKKIIAVSEVEKEQILKYLKGVKNKIVVIGNGVDNSMIESYLSSLGKKEVLRKKYKIPVNRFVYLYFGRIHKIKNLDLILDAFIKINNNHKFSLVIAGEDGGALDELLKKAKSSGMEDGVFFFNDQNKFDKYELYKLADAYLLFSKSDPFGMTLLEASSCGLPIGISKSVGLYKDVKRLGCGVILRDFTIESAKLCLEELHNNAMRLSIKSRLLSKQYDLTKTNNAIMKLYEMTVL